MSEIVGLIEKNVWPSLHTTNDFEHKKVVKALQRISYSFKCTYQTFRTNFLYVLSIYFLSKSYHSSF